MKLKLILLVFISDTIYIAYSLTRNSRSAIHKNIDTGDNLKNIYLDWSDLQRLIDGDLSSKATDLLLSNRICISLYHLIDFSLGDDIEKQKKRALYIDKIPNILFFRDMDTVQAVEIANRICDSFQISPFTSNFVVKQRLYQIMNARGKTKEELILDDSFTNFISQLHEFPELKKTMLTVSNQSKLQAIRLNVDRAQANENYSLLEKEDILLGKKNELLRELIFEAIFLINLYYKIDPHRITYINHDFYIDGNNLTHLLSGKDELPLYNFMFRYLNSYADYLSKKKAGSRSMMQRGSDMADYGHLYALQYSDIFTCDKRTHSLISKSSSTHDSFVNKVISFSNFTNFEKEIIALIDT